MNVHAKTLRQWAGYEVVPSRGVGIALGIAAFVVITALSAYAAVPLPLTPVPITLQSLAVILAGALLGPWAGAAAMASYIALGIAGVPVFSGGAAGIAWLLGPTGGYLIAFPAAACAVGLVAGSPRSRGWRLLAGLFAGTAVIFIGGVSQLVVVTGQGFASAFALGVAPFLVGGVLKILIAFVVARQIGAAGSGRLWSDV